MQESAQAIEVNYDPLPTGIDFHNSMDRIRAIVGPVGSGKTSMGAWECCYYMPKFLMEEYGWDRTRWCVTRNTYRELIDTTQATILEWFDWGDYYGKREMYTLEWPNHGFTVELLFRACDLPKHVRQFKSLELTGYWGDESIEIAKEVKLMLRNRIGRYPKMRCEQCGMVMKTVSEGPDDPGFYRCKKCGHEEHPRFGIKFGIETTNPPDVEHETYSEFDWGTEHPPPGPLPSGQPKRGYRGFWQPPYENIENLTPGYYQDLMEDYSDHPDWATMYVLGQPGIVVKGKLVHNGFRKDVHVSKTELKWDGDSPLIRGFDNSGNCPACLVIDRPGPKSFRVLREFKTDKLSIVEFANDVRSQCEQIWPGASYTDWGDPAGENKFSKPKGGFTSNAQLMREECGIDPRPSDQNFTARINAVDILLNTPGGLLIDPSCTRYINGFLGGYHYPEIGTTGRYADYPEKNRYSHLQDAGQYAYVKYVIKDKDSLFGGKLKNMFVD